MKKLIACLLLATYCCASCTALLPIVKDIAAHLFWHKEHIEHVHHGHKNQDHLAIEMAQLLDEGQNQDAIFAGSKTAKSDLSVHICSSVFFKTINIPARKNRAFPRLWFALPKGVKASIFLPPKRS